MIGFIIWSVLFNSDSYTIKDKSNTIPLRHQMLTRPERPNKKKKRNQ